MRLACSERCFVVETSRWFRRRTRNCPEIVLCPTHPQNCHFNLEKTHQGLRFNLVHVRSQHQNRTCATNEVASFKAFPSQLFGRSLSIYFRPPIPASWLRHGGYGGWRHGTCGRSPLSLLATWHLAQAFGTSNQLSHGGCMAALHATTTAFLGPSTPIILQVQRLCPKLAISCVKPRRNLWM